MLKLFQSHQAAHRTQLKGQKIRSHINYDTTSITSTKSCCSSAEFQKLSQEMNPSLSWRVVVNNGVGAIIFDGGIGDNIGENGKFK